jgi:hypothetical protein
MPQTALRAGDWGNRQALSAGRRFGQLRVIALLLCSRSSEDAN